MGGTLSDNQIREYCEDGRLIADGFENTRIKQACYELTASSVYHKITQEGHAERIRLEDNDYILIKPRQIVVVITRETLSLPNDVLGRVLTKGKLFSIGISPVNTYADPGFEGELGIVLHNDSNNYLKIEPGETIAKMEFSVLDQPVEDPYTGQHGNSIEVWPVPRHMILSDNEIEEDHRVKDVVSEIRESHGDRVARAMNRVFNFERHLILSSALFFVIVFIFILFIESKNISKLAGVAIGLVSNLLTGAAVYGITSLKQ